MHARPACAAFEVAREASGIHPQRTLPPSPSVRGDGFITPEQAGKIKVIKQHYEDLEARKAELESIILPLAEFYSEELNLILTVPSISNLFSAIAVVSEIGVTMDVFPSAKHLCS